MPRLPTGLTPRARGASSVLIQRSDAYDQLSSCNERPTPCPLGTQVMSCLIGAKPPTYMTLRSHSWYMSSIRNRWLSSVNPLSAPSVIVVTSHPLTGASSYSDCGKP
jgi:hypothetical protein